ncbi:MAG: isochorismate synthase MenF [Nodosilinea sp.]
MPVVPYCPFRCQDLQAVYHFIANGLDQVKRQHQPQVASISLGIADVDPLLVLAHLTHRHEHHLYLENVTAATAVAAVGSALSYQSAGTERFRDAQRFIHQWRSQTCSYADRVPRIPPLGPNPWLRFYCSFTFFSPNSGIGLDFPGASVVLPRWQVLRQRGDCVLTTNLLLTPNTVLPPLLEELEARLSALEHLSQTRLCVPRPRPELDPLPPASLAGEQFKASVATALRHMACHPTQKIVLAHVFDLVRETPFQTFPALMQLRQRHPDCYVFALHNGQGKTFLGASPERLLSLCQGRLMTDALAGSAPRGATTQQDQRIARRLLHSRKERAEHQLVVDFLTHQLAGLGLRPHYPPTPALFRLSNIQHLHTPIQALVQGCSEPLQVVEALHPTPAVAGVPTSAACEQIHAFEQFDRGLYAAPLGWVGANGDSEFIVGIRSALIADNWARLYAGAGIVAGSDPEREWAEINLKFRALSESLV